MSKIEFIEGENWCRYNGILMDYENCIKLFGTGYIDVYSEDFIVWEDGNIYTDLSFYEIIKALSYKETDSIDDYDEVISQGFGFERYSIEKQYENSFFLNKETIKYINSIKPLSEFNKKYPKVKIKDIIEFQNELDKYYENRKINIK